MTQLRGLTWGHRRAIDPLKASTILFKSKSGIDVDWQVRSLEKFEHQSFAEAVASVDLVVFDHPHVGDVVDLGLLRPLDKGAESWPSDRSLFVGRCLSTYSAAGSTWAVPVDAATIHSVYRPDLLQNLGEQLPLTWSDAIRFMRMATRRGMTCFLAARGHHLLLTLASLMANIGHPWRTGERAKVILDKSALATAIDLVDEALDAGDRTISLECNAIQAHDLLAHETDALFCLAAYGYATYGEREVWPNRLAFGPFVGPGPVACAGTVIGGAGVGVTHACSDPESAFAYVAHLADPAIQCGVFATASGQPARAEAWNDPIIDGRYNGFFSNVSETLKSATVRPQFAGYPLIEQKLSDILHRYMAGEITRLACVDQMANCDLQG